MRLVVNGQYVGLYTSPEQRDVTFLKNRGSYREGASWLDEINGGIFRDDSVNTVDSPTHHHLTYSPFYVGAGSTAQPSNPTVAIGLETDIPQWVNMRGMLPLAAIERFITNGDGLFTKSASGQGKNSFCMDALLSTKIPRMYLSWDLDAGFSATNWNIFTGGGGGEPALPDADSRALLVQGTI